MVIFNLLVIFYKFQLFLKGKSNVFLSENELHKAEYFWNFCLTY